MVKAFKIVGAGLVALLGTAASGPDKVQQMAPPEKLVFVEHGKPLAVVYEGAPWREDKGVLVGAGADHWLLAKRGLVAGDYRFDCFGFDARRATVELESFAAEGHFAPGTYKPGVYTLLHHPKT